MPNEPRWITSGEVVRANANIVATTGEPHQLDKPDLLESACARPCNRWAYDGEDDVVALACSLLFGVAQNHPFMQGNKRTGYVAAIAFLAANGYRVDVPDVRPVADAIIEVVEHKAREFDFADAFREYVSALN